MRSGRELVPLGPGRDIGRRTKIQNEAQWASKVDYEELPHCMSYAEAHTKVKIFPTVIINTILKVFICHVVISTHPTRHLSLSGRSSEPNLYLSPVALKRIPDKVPGTIFPLKNKTKSI